MEKDTVLAAIGSAIGLAGLLLVFVGFIYTHGESFSSEATKRKFQRVAKAGIIPFSVALLCAWFCLRWLQWGGLADYSYALLLFKLSLLLTLAYGIIAVIVYL
jgi:hypothetical protein